MSAGEIKAAWLGSEALVASRSSRKSNEGLSDVSFGWPEILPLQLAKAFTGLSRWTIMKAARDGELPLAGRRRRTPCFRRCDLEAWLSGGPVAPLMSIASAARPVNPPRATEARGTRAALARLKQITRRGTK